MWRELESFTWENVPEVAILAVLIFGLLTLLQGTRGEGMLKTLAGFLAITYIVVRGLATWDGWDEGRDLGRLTLVLDAIFQASVIALVVIFQPELRRGLALKIGANLFTGNTADAARPIAEEVIGAAQALSRTRIGALMVLERKNSLTQYVGTGTEIDAAVTSALLQSIFYVGTPLHDGAVIISEGRIAAAGCFLPSTDNPSVPKTLGSRHRAGIGLSEEEDALVVIVSEETGGISLAEAGTLHRDLDRDGLLDMLEQLYLKPQEDTIAESPIDTMDGGLGEAAVPEKTPKPAVSSKATTRVPRRPVAP